MGAAAAVEKKAFVLRALFSALRERRCTPRCVSMVDDVDDDEVGERTGRACQRIKLLFTLRRRLHPTERPNALGSVPDAPHPSHLSLLSFVKYVLFDTAYGEDVAYFIMYCVQYSFGGRRGEWSRVMKRRLKCRTPLSESCHPRKRIIQVA